MASLLSAATNTNKGSGVAVTGSQLTVKTSGLIGYGSNVIIQHAFNNVAGEYKDFAKVKNGSENVYIASGSGFIRAYVSEGIPGADYSVDVDVEFGA